MLRLLGECSAPLGVTATAPWLQVRGRGPMLAAPLEVTRGRMSRVDGRSGLIQAQLHAAHVVLGAREIHLAEVLPGGREMHLAQVAHVVRGEREIQVHLAQVAHAVHGVRVRRGPGQTVGPVMVWLLPQRPRLRMSRLGAVRQGRGRLGQRWWGATRLTHGKVIGSGGKTGQSGLKARGKESKELGHKQIQPGANGPPRAGKAGRSLELAAYSA